MPIFAYRAFSEDTTSIQGTISADGPRAARELLRNRGLVVESVVPQKSQTTRSWWPLRKKRHVAKRIEMLRELSTLLEAGIPLLEALDSQAKQNRGSFRVSLMLVRDQVAAGSTLADSLRERPEVFDPLSIQMVEVGENSGTLHQVLGQLAKFSERYMQLKDRVVNALFYPIMVFLMSMGVGMFLMTVVVPMLLDNLIEADKAIPWPTRVLKGLSDTIRQHGLLIGIVFSVTFIGLSLVLRTKKGQRVWHKILLQIPLLGSMARKQEIARVALIVSTLLRSGIVLLKAMEIAGRSIKNSVLFDALESSRNLIQSGQDIGPSLESTGEFPPTVIQIFAVGQQSGKLESMLERLAENYDRQVATLSLRLASMLEPILIIGLALFVGFILFATVLPILEAGNVLN